MNNHELIEDLEGDLISYMGKMKAKNFASKLFKELGKDKIMLNKVEYLYRELRQKNIDGNTISKVMHMVEKGKKKAILRLLMKSLGEVGGVSYSISSKMK